MCQSDNKIALLFSPQTGREFATHFGHAPVFKAGGPRGDGRNPFPVVGVSVMVHSVSTTAILFYEADDTDADASAFEYLVLLEAFWNL